MLVVIDMQNHILDPLSQFYIPGIESLVPRIADRISQARDWVNISYTHKTFR